MALVRLGTHRTFEHQPRGGKKKMGPISVARGARRRSRRSAVAALLCHLPVAAWLLCAWLLIMAHKY